MGYGRNPLAALIGSHGCRKPKIQTIKELAMARFKDIKQMSKTHYNVHVSWDYLEEQLKSYSEKSSGTKFDLNPDFQRGHVWTKEQQIAYVEFIIRGGESGLDIFFNCPGWMNDYRGPMELVDGLQRITAVLAFLHNEIPAYGHLFSEYEDKRFVYGLHFNFHVANLPTRAEVLQWYLDLNSGVAHTKQELDRVGNLLLDEINKS